MKLNEMDVDLSITSTIPTAWNRDPYNSDGRRDSFDVAPLRVAEWGFPPTDLLFNSRHGVTRSRPYPAPSVLAGWVRQEVERLNWGSECVERAQPLLGPKASLILEMLAFDAVMGVFWDGKVAKADQESPLTAGMSEGSVPTTKELEQFRDRHPSLVETATANVLALALR